MSLEVMTVEQGYQQLAGAICEQAVNDYRVALKLAQEGGKKFREKVIQLERFFRSDWFRALTRNNIDGDWLMKEVQRQCRTSRPF